MKKLLLAFFVLISAGASGQAQQFFVKTSQSGYFFYPSRPIYNYRPDYYVYGNRGWGAYGWGRTPWGFSAPYRYGYDCARYVAPQTLGVYQLFINAPRGEIIRANTSDLIFNGTPSKALVYVDGKLIGSAGDFSNERDRYMVVTGEHQLRICFPGYKPFEAEMDIVANRTLHFDIELEHSKKQ